MGNHLESNHRDSIGGAGRIGRDGMCGVKRALTLIVIHCTATRMDVDFTEQALLRSHLARGMKMTDYHFYIRKDGYIHSTRPLVMAGAHAKGYNAESIGIAYEGGLNVQGIPADTRTQRQKFSMRALIRVLKMDFAISRVCGHRDLSPDRDGDGVVEPHEWTKQCPCFDVASDKWCS